MTPKEAARLKPNDKLELRFPVNNYATVLDQFANQLILLWDGTEIHHHTAASFPFLHRVKHSTNTNRSAPHQRGRISGFGNRRNAPGQREGTNPRLRSGPRAPGAARATQPSGPSKGRAARKHANPTPKIERNEHKKPRHNNANHNAATRAPPPHKRRRALHHVPPLDTPQNLPHARILTGCER